MNNFGKCPSCKTPYIDPRVKKTVDEGTLKDEQFSAKKGGRSLPVSKSAPSRVSATSDPLVEAQNRTTHAVRSLAITFVATPIIAFVLTFYLAYALRIEDMLQVGVGLTLGVIALVWTAYEALQELGKSRVPNL
jgi:hypothetical protein